MTRLRRGSIRIEYDRTGQNQELQAYWDRLEERPYYHLEKNYTDGLGLDSQNCPYLKFCCMSHRVHFNFAI